MLCLKKKWSIVYFSLFIREERKKYTILQKKRYKIIITLKRNSICNLKEHFLYWNKILRKNTFFLYFFSQFFLLWRKQKKNFKENINLYVKLLPHFAVQNTLWEKIGFLWDFYFFLSFCIRKIWIFTFLTALHLFEYFFSLLKIIKNQKITKKLLFY